MLSGRGRPRAGPAISSPTGPAVATDDDRWQALIQGLRDGDGQVLQSFCARYGEMLHRVADAHMPAPLRRRVGPEDIAQSACRTFLRRARDGQFRLSDAEQLWRLLCAITLTKLREQARFHLRKKRGLDQEAQWAAGDSTAGASAFHPPAPGPSPADAAAFAIELQHVLELLDEEERQIVELKLQEYTNDEVAERLGCSERTVRRIVKTVQAKLSRAFGEPPP